MTIIHNDNLSLPIPGSSIYEINKFLFGKRNISIFDITLKSRYQIIAKRIFENMKSKEFAVKIKRKTLVGDYLQKKPVMMEEEFDSLTSESLNRTITHSNILSKSHSSDEIRSSFNIYNEEKAKLNK